MGRTLSPFGSKFLRRPALGDDGSEDDESHRRPFPGKSRGFHRKVFATKASDRDVFVNNMWNNAIHKNLSIRDIAKNRLGVVVVDDLLPILERQTFA